MKNENIQVLRGYAIFLVFFMHLPVILFPEQLARYDAIVLRYFHPATGVDLFFVLSGYLMGKIFISGIDGKPDISQSLRFYKRRMLRLVPASHFWILMTLGLAILFDKYDLWLPIATLIKKVIASLFFVRNFVEASEPTHLGYYWSLSTEVQFYLLLPVMLWIFGKSRLPYILIFFLFIGLFFRFGGEMWWMFRYDGLLIGILIYYLLESPSLSQKVERLLPKRKVFISISIVLILFLIARLPVSLGSKPYVAYFLVSLLSGWLLIQAIYNLKMEIFHKIDYLWFRFLGDISYSTYLVHIPVWLVCKYFLIRFHIENGGLILMFFLALFSAVFFGWLSFKYIETPWFMKSLKDK